MTPIMPPDQQQHHQHHHHHGGYRRPYKEDDPSYYRRKELMGEMSDSVSVSSFFPIERYFAAADTVFAAFNKVLDQDDLDSTFVYGKRYCNFIVNEMPKHNYFQRDKYAKQRTDHQKNIVVILPHLETIKAKMDEECRAEHKRYLEQVRIEKARREQERLRQEKLQAQREAAKYKELMKRAEQQKKAQNNADANGDGGKDVKQSAMNKLEMLMKKSSTTPEPNRPSGRYALSDEEDDDEAYHEGGPALSIGEPLPPPLPPPDGPASHSTSSGSLSEAPPSYNFAVKSDRPNPFLKNGSNGGMLACAVPPPVQTWGDSRPPSYNSVSGSTSLPDPPTRRYPSQQRQQHQQQQPAAKRPKKIPMRQMRERAKQMYQKFIQDKRIEIRPVDTYQGRYSRSTNGCTVISPLVVAHHLASPIGMLVTDQEIKHVIDEECGPLLREIRGKLGLESGSLIIPSDVHDHLVDKNILKQDYFVGATGGNIVGQEHKNEFIKLFKEKQKAGAALFFREHVVSIVKTPIGNGKAYYDLVDSMPGTNDARGNPCASRTRCMDEQAFDVLLTWYATKKFSEGNCSYIDKNDWNDNMADLDPRVFQAFVWGKDM